MIEVLISILVMSFGLLGISGLMMKGIDNSTGTELASRASQSASEIMDAMRANPDNAALYLTNYGTDPATLTGTTPDQTDLKQWLTALKNNLPSGQGEITGSVANGFTVKIRYANCIGTLSPDEKTQCAAATNNTDKRTVQFKFKI